MISGRLRLVEIGLESWDRRARLLLPLYAMLEDGSRAVPSLNTDTMDVLQLAFRTQANTKENKSIDWLGNWWKCLFFL